MNSRMTMLSTTACPHCRRKNQVKNLHLEYDQAFVIYWCGHCGTVWTRHNDGKDYDLLIPHRGK